MALASCPSRSENSRSALRGHPAGLVACCRSDAAIFGKAVNGVTVCATTRPSGSYEKSIAKAHGCPGFNAGFPDLPRTSKRYSTNRKWKLASTLLHVFPLCRDCMHPLN